MFRRSSPSPTVIIICGGRRTGTTLLNAILATDARANPLGPEAQILTRIVEAYRWGRERFDEEADVLPEPEKPQIQADHDCNGEPTCSLMAFEPRHDERP